MALAHNIRYLRKKQGMSQEDLADRLGYKSYTTIQKWESGVSSPPLWAAHAIADMFSVDIDSLMRDPLELLDTYMSVQQTEQPAAPEWYNELSEEDKALVQLIMKLPPSQKRILTDLAESWKPQQNEETHGAGQQ